MKPIKLVYSNKFIAWAMLLLQIFVLTAGFIWLSDYSRVMFGATTGLSALLLIYEINRREAPEFKMTWMVIIAIIPVFGALMYIYTRFGFISRGIASQHKGVCADIKQHIKSDGKAKGEISQKPYSGLALYLERCADAPVYGDSEVRYYELGEKLYTEMKKELESAKDFIFMEFFIINTTGTVWREIFDILSRKVREGVEVRFLYDGMGSLTSIPKNFAAILENAGIKHAAFAPVQPLLSTYQNNRDHRKIIVIDGRVAFTGGINIADEYVNLIDRFGHWKDNGIKIRGSAVSRFTALFLEMWNTANVSVGDDYERYIGIGSVCEGETEGYIIPYGDCPLDDNKIGKRVYIDLINNAREYVHIMTPYLVPDNEMIEALRYAVERGVDVKIIIPHHPDKVYAYWLAHTYFPELISYGVEIYEYTPGFIHAKTVIADGKASVVGTINFDYRSFYLHYECAAVMFEMPVIGEIEKDFINTLDISMRITAAQYKRFNPFTKLLGRAIRIVAPLL